MFLLFHKKIVLQSEDQERIVNMFPPSETEGELKQLNTVVWQVLA